MKARRLSLDRACALLAGLTIVVERGNIAGFVPAEAPAGVPMVKLEITFCGK